jgi:hypothetical protein
MRSHYAMLDGEWFALTRAALANVMTISNLETIASNRARVAIHSFPVMERLTEEESGRFLEYVAYLAPYTDAEYLVSMCRASSRSASDPAVSRIYEIIADNVSLNCDQKSDPQTVLEGVFSAALKARRKLKRVTEGETKESQGKVNEVKGSR